MNSKQNSMASVAKYVACGIIIGSAVGTAATVMIKSHKKPSTLKEKAAAAMDTVGTIMQNVADFTR